MENALLAAPWPCRAAGDDASRRKANTTTQAHASDWSVASARAASSCMQKQIACRAYTAPCSGALHNLWTPARKRRVAGRRTKAAISNIVLHRRMLPPSLVSALSHWLAPRTVAALVFAATTTTAVLAPRVLAPASNHVDKHKHHSAHRKDDDMMHLVEVCLVCD
jgi:hypothetical protein